jgi:rubrerythrin
MGMQFETFEEILEFAIGQERAAQVFYAHLADEASDPEKSRYYRELVAQEQGHEQKLTELKDSQLNMPTPDLEDLRKCGYLDSMPLAPEMEWKQVLKYLIKKEKSAKMLYTVLANSTAKQELSELFQYLAEQECDHADYFQHEYNACLNAE